MKYTTSLLKLILIKPSVHAYSKKINRGKNGDACNTPSLNPNNPVWMTSAACCHHGNGNLSGNCEQGDWRLGCKQTS